LDNRRQVLLRKCRSGRVLPTRTSLDLPASERIGLAGGRAAADSPGQFAQRRADAISRPGHRSASHSSIFERPLGCRGMAIGMPPVV